jgi:hypothetical protein
MINKQEKHYYVVTNGLNQLGADALNQYYEEQFKSGNIKQSDVKNNRYTYCPNKFKVGDKVATKRSKRFKITNDCFSESIFENYHRLDLFIGFELKIKHFNCTVYEVEVVETFKEVKI